MALEGTAGTLKYKDKDGNVYILIPKTWNSQVVGLSEDIRGAINKAKAYTDSAIQSAIQNTWEASY